jgi:GDP-L-fucose synthase
MRTEEKILITGSNGLVGTALATELRAAGYDDVVLHTRKECDLTDYKATLDYFHAHRPSQVFHLAAAVYGIMGNMENQARSFLDNTLINTHVVEASRQIKVRKITALGSGCVYPYPPARVPLCEDDVFNGRPHGSEAAYAHAKRAMLAQLEAYQADDLLDYAYVISGNLFGPHDMFDAEHGHVTPALVKKFHDAERNGTPVTVWGDGSAQRDFMYCEDAASALIAIAMHVNGPVNMGSGTVSRIRDVVDVLAEITGTAGRLQWDSTKPNGQAYREYDLSKLQAAGFRSKVSLAEGIRRTYAWYAENYPNVRTR